MQQVLKSSAISPTDADLVHNALFYVAPQVFFSWRTSHIVQRLTALLDSLVKANVQGFAVARRKRMAVSSPSKNLWAWCAAKFTISKDSAS